MQRTLVLALAALLHAGPACAQNWLATGENRGWMSELRGGLLAHDPDTRNGREGGLSINGELLFASPLPRAWADALPPQWRWLATPRPHLGFSAHTAGATSRGYAGLTWTTFLARELFRREDGLRLDLFGGASINDGQHGPVRPDRRALGGNLLFRVGGEIGYQWGPHWSVGIFLDHVSNAGLARNNQGLNNVGLRLGYAF